MEIIKSSDEISLVFKEGKRLNTTGITVLMRKNEKQHGHVGRVAFVAGKKHGNAVWRNKAKRRMRSVCCEVNGVLPQYDVVYLARPRVNDIEFKEMVLQVRRVLERNGFGPLQHG